MNVLKIVFITFCILTIGSIACATQEIKGVSIVDTQIDYDNKVCTIIIDRDHPVTDLTSKCTSRKFSWRCFSDDYLWHMVLHVKKNNLTIDIRYSDEKCFGGKQNNMLLLTAW